MSPTSSPRGRAVRAALRPRAAPALPRRTALSTALSSALPSALAALLALPCGQAAAQASPPAVQAAVPAPAPPADQAASRIVITGNPLGSTALAQPSAVLTGEALALRRAGTLGDTLSGLVGISATGFGPQASRPVIRGLDGDRIRLLDNGGASADASNLSADHAVAIDPLVVERIEVLRGPAALLYGGNATGGVVNTLDNRIPRDLLGAAGGRAELRLGGAAAERAAAVLLEGGQGGSGRASGLNWHLDAAQRDSADLRTPRFSPPTEALAGSATRRVANSAGSSRAAALGGSWTDAQGYAGIAVDDYRNDYGVTVDPEVTIRMQRQRLQLAGERRGLAGPFQQLSLQASQTRYQHQEVEGSGAVGTTFSSRGSELRLQARQAPLDLAGLGRLGGMLGLQFEQLDFAALGAEAFVPGSHTRSSSAFVLQELAPAGAGGLLLSAGARLERVRVDSNGDTDADAAARFGPAQRRRFSPHSLSLGAVLPLGPQGSAGAGWRASATLGRTERAPAYAELFADGVHVATGAYERGDTGQQPERSRHLELGLQWQQAGELLRAALFSTRFANHIALAATGASVAVDGGGALPEYRFTGVPARLSGLELEGRSRLRSGPWQLDASAGLDLVRGSDSRSGQPLPRLAPLRLQLGLDAAQGDWRLGLATRALARQDRVPVGDSATPGSVLVDLWATWQQRLGGADALWSLKLANLGDALAYNASALRSARLLAPSGGRALTAGLRLSF